MDIQIPKDVPTRQSLRRDITNMVNPLLKDVREPLDEFNEEIRRSRSEVRNAVSPLKSLGDSGSMSDPMGKGKPKLAQPPTPMATLPSELGTWSAKPSTTAPSSEQTTTEQDLGTWGQIGMSDREQSVRQSEES
jgi:hypothetical protein